jgi:hypothetical protein
MRLSQKWPGRLVTLQHLVLFRDTLIYFSYYRILNVLTSQRNRTFSEQSRLLLYHALRTSTCQKLNCVVGIEPTARAYSHFYGVIYHHSEH